MKPKDIEIIYKMTFGKSSANLERIGELIRCKDCKHSQEDLIFGGYWCMGNNVKADHYCGYARRREEK